MRYAIACPPCHGCITSTPETRMRANRPRLLACLALTVAVVPIRSARGQLSPADSAQLIRTTQALADAIATGDTAVWAGQLASNWILSDEEGNWSSRQEFLAGLHSLPEGQSGRLVLARWRIIAGPNLAVLTYDLDEEHHFYTQLLLTRFHSTDTWIRSGGRWVQVASQVTALPRALEGAAVPAALAREYAGTYRLTPELALVVAVGDSGLSIGRAGQPGARLYALDDRLFVRHGVRGFWVFERDSSGAVKRLVNWRDNNAVTWDRVE